MEYFESLLYPVFTKIANELGPHAEIFRLDAPEWARAQILPNEDQRSWYSKNRHWWGEHWGLPLFASALYVVLIFGIKRVMKDRQPFDLRGPLFLWNLGLSAFSGVGLYVVGGVLLRRYASGVSVSQDACDFYTEDETPWVYYFCISKLPELIDTIFIVLRKKPLIFLHWYHHIATLLYCWLAWTRRFENGGNFAAMNLFVHTIMYGYYACSARGIRFPEHLTMCITILQITQMVIGTLLVVHNYLVCNTDPAVTVIGFCMYFSYFLLFFSLFLGRFFRKSKGKKQRSSAKKDQ